MLPHAPALWCGFLLCCAALTAAEPPRPEHPRPDWMRAAWLNLNGTWEFRFGDGDVGLFRPFVEGQP